jgi:Ca2+-binding EF-hand superfamily protein
MDSFFSFEFH